MRILLINNIYPHYRKEIWEKLSNLPDIEVKILFGNNLSSVIEPANSFIKDNRVFKNLYFNKILVWQFGVIPYIVYNNFDVYIFNGECFCISTWLASLILKFKKKKIIFWGHGIYGNEKYFIKYFRILFNVLPNVNLLYSDYSKKLLDDYLPSKKKYVIKNSINYYESLKYRQSFNLSPILNNIFSFSPNTKYLLFIGRIVKNKKINLIIEALRLLDNEFNLIIIGKGDEHNSILSLVKNYNLQDRVFFLQDIYDEQYISYIISNCDLLVSPGNVGLNAIHSLQYGTPVCTHNNFTNQMPEFESIIPYKTGFFFIENDHLDLYKQITFWFNNYYKNDIIKKCCYQIIDEYYNPDYQCKIFCNAIY